jgi:hypothetical protein
MKAATGMPILGRLLRPPTSRLALAMMKAAARHADIRQTPPASGESAGAGDAGF